MSQVLLNYLRALLLAGRPSRLCCHTVAPAPTTLGRSPIERAPPVERHFDRPPVRFVIWKGALWDDDLSAAFVASDGDQAPQAPPPALEPAVGDALSADVDVTVPWDILPCCGLGVDPVCLPVASPQNSWPCGQNISGLVRAGAARLIFLLCAHTHTHTHLCLFF